MAVTSAVLACLCLPPAGLFAAPDNPTGLRLVLVGGPSMHPLLGTMNVLLLRRAGHLQRYDVAEVVHRGIHRIVALPGETFWTVRGRFCVQGPRTPRQCLAEPYVRITHAWWNRPPQRLGPQEYAWAPDDRAGPWVRVIDRRAIDAVLVLPLLSWGGRWH
jgi:hypothetical protein